MTGGPTFESGARVKLVTSGYDATISYFIGAGGQGEVYAVDVAGSLYALKWYHTYYLRGDRRLRERLSNAIEQGPPDQRFLWPIELVDASRSDSFGYLMLLRLPSYQPSRNLLAAFPKRLDPPLSVRVMMCLNIAECFLQLHAKGFCYQDVSLNNLFFDPSNGAVCIVDNDNVDVNGMPGAIYGTRKFMAPEVVRRENFPNTASDLYSMAVLFFYLLHSWHPLEGQREADVMIMDDDELLKLYGTHPLFIFDQHDQSNGPLSGMHDPIVRRWKSLSDTARRLFTRSFTDGLAPHKRVMETEWLNGLSRMYDSLIACPNCGYEHAIAGASEPSRGVSSFPCVACNVAIRVPPRLVIGKDVVNLGPNRALYPHHLTGSSTYKFDQANALVRPHPSNINVLGLCNLTQTSWSASSPGGQTTTISPGKTVRITPGLSIDFGSRRGTIVM